MQAIILAAGMGKRLKELTKNNTKCMIKVDGITLIERMLKQLENKHLSKIVIVVGYESAKLIAFIDSLKPKTPIVYVNNPIYDKTNNIYSLYLAKEYLQSEDTLLLESDLIFEEAVLEELLNDPRETLALVDKYESWMDGTCMKLDSDDRIEAFIPGSKFQFSENKNYYKTVNIYKFSRHFSETHYVPFLEAYVKALGNNEYYEQVLRVITMLDAPEIQAKRLNGQRWYEIDDVQDLDIATTLFTADVDKRVSLLQHRYGGYWRYPHLIDFCYLVNPYYPPQKLLDEINASLSRLLLQYPSGMSVNSLLAGKLFGIHVENIVIGNGASELIRILAGYLTGKIGLSSPSFDEYPNRFSKKDIVVYRTQAPYYSYNQEDLIDYFTDKEIHSLIIVNPDNPTGNYIPRNKIDILVQWAKSNEIILIIDESFVDFSDDENATLLQQGFLEANPHVIVLKSISKSHGIPGARLGVLATGNKDIINYIKQDAAIWNINSIAEFYMQIAEKYKKEFKLSIEKLRLVRKEFQRKLEEINGIEVLPSQGNFFMIRLPQNISSNELTKRMLIKYNMLIKDLSSKVGNSSYIRVAIRTTEENECFVNALHEAVRA